MPTCWIIEQGSYSDYRVIGIYSTKENAEHALAYIKKDPHGEEPYIDERHLDPAITELNEGLIQFSIRMLFNGEVTINLRRDLESKDITWKDGACYNIWARDRDHAIKIAAERFAQYSAERNIPHAPQIR